jgi:ssDNA-binding Zn-finger/Zn-ribbon topoisomerase 1
MYCPKCDRTIPDEKVQEISKELEARFKSDALANGQCPVCKTPLLASKERRK